MPQWSDRLDSRYFENLGRVVVSAASLDVMLATVVCGVSEQYDEGTDLWEIASTPGRPLREAR